MTSPALPGDRRTLRNFYALRAVVAFAWVIAALASAHLPLAAAAVLLTIYPAWDALANLLDARRHGGWRAQPGQRVNAAISLATAIGMAVALAVQGNRGGVLVFGVWALLAGLLQLIVAIRRRPRSTRTSVARRPAATLSMSTTIAPAARSTGRPLKTTGTLSPA